MTPIDLAGVQKELGKVAQKAADAQAAFLALGGAASKLTLKDVTAALKTVEAEERRVAKERERAVKESLREIERVERESLREQQRIAKDRAEAFRVALRQAFDGTYFRAALSPFQAGLAALQTHVVGFVAKANPAAAIRLNLALDDLQATIGRALIPAINQFTRLLRGVGAAFNGLDTNGRTLVASIAAGTVGLIAFGAAAQAFQTIASGGVLPVLSALAGAFGGFAFVSGELGPVMQELGSLFSGALNHFGAVVAGFAGGEAVAAVVTALAEVAGVLVDVAGTVLGSLMPAFNAFASLVQVFTPIITTAAGAFGSLLNAVVGMWAEGVVLAVETAAPYLLAFGQLAIDVSKMIYEGWRSLLSYIGINLPEFGSTNAPKGDTPDNTGAAARRTSTGNVSDVLQRAREAAFGAGTGKVDKQDKANTHLANIEDEAKKIVAGVKKFVEDFPDLVATALWTKMEQAKESIVAPAERALASLPTTPGGAISAAGDLAKEAYDRARSLFN